MTNSSSSDDALLQLASDFPAAADYLSTILLIKRDYGDVHNTMLSDRLGVSKPAVSQAVSRLKHINLVHQDSYGVIELTPAGTELAENIIRRHYLIEHLLIQSVDYPWERADAEALRLQTVISDDLADHLFEAFGRPTVCPHGNPFPGSEEEAELLAAPRLTACSPGPGFRLLRITEEGEGVDGLLKYCRERDLRPGVAISLVEIVDGTAVRVAAGGRELEIPWSVAEHLAVAVGSDDD